MSSEVKYLSTVYSFNHIRKHIHKVCQFSFTKVWGLPQRQCFLDGCMKREVFVLYKYLIFLIYINFFLPDGKCVLFSSFSNWWMKSVSIWNCSAWQTPSLDRTLQPLRLTSIWGTFMGITVTISTVRHWVRFVSDAVWKTCQGQVAISLQWWKRGSKWIGWFFKTSISQLWICVAAMEIGSVTLEKTWVLWKCA